MQQPITQLTELVYNHPNSPKKRNQQRNHLSSVDSQTRNTSINTFCHFIPQRHNSFSKDTCNCISIFWRKPDNLHYVSIMNLQSYNNRKCTIMLQDVNEESSREGCLNKWIKQKINIKLTLLQS